MMMMMMEKREKKGRRAEKKKRERVRGKTKYYPLLLKRGGREEREGIEKGERKKRGNEWDERQNITLSFASRLLPLEPVLPFCEG